MSFDFRYEGISLYALLLIVYLYHGVGVDTTVDTPSGVINGSEFE